MIILGAHWTAQVNLLHIECETCGGKFNHRADRWKVRCSSCNKVENLQRTRNRYLRDHMIYAKMDGKVLTLKIAGVSFNSRAKLIALVSENAMLVLEPEPDNAFDSNAIKIMTQSGVELGYVPKEATAAIHARKVYKCWLSEHTKHGKKIVGGIIAIAFKAPALAKRRRRRC